MKKTTKSAFHRGFTLIELMIVIVILGILMGTILPRLSGAQSRARDTARMADLNSIAQALELYYDDFGKYPAVATAGAPDCLVAGTGAGGDKGLPTATFNVLKTYFKGSNVPLPPSSSEAVAFDGTTCAGSYMYLSLDSKGSENQAYGIIVNVETPTKANLLVDVNSKLSDEPGALATLSYDDDTDINTLLTVVRNTADADPTLLVTADTDDDTGASTLYVVGSGI